MVRFVGRCLSVPGLVSSGELAGLVEACLVVRCDEVVLMGRCGIGRAFWACWWRANIFDARTLSRRFTTSHNARIYIPTQTLVSIHHSL